MRTISREASTLLIVDIQSRLIPVIDAADSVLANARHLIDAAELLTVPVVFTEQNAEGLGPTVPELRPQQRGVITHKMSFDACRVSGFAKRLADRSDVVVAGCEAHVCVQQTVLGLLNLGRRVYVVRDAVGARRAESKETAIRRMERHGAEIVTTEMVVFEWLETAQHPRFREALGLIK
jgi:nicotinamidase-related amidase